MTLVNADPPLVFPSTFDLLPLEFPRWLRMMIGITAGGMVIPAAFAFENGNPRYGMFLVVVALMSTMAGKFLRRLTPVSVSLDEMGIIQRGTSEFVVPWTSIEKVGSGPDFIALYYKRGPEPRLLGLEAARFRSEDWEVIRSLILSRAPDEPGGK